MFLRALSPRFRWFVACLALLAVPLALAEDDAADSFYDNIVIVLDASGSMASAFTGNPSQTKMEAAKMAISRVLGQIDASTHVGLLVFSASNVSNEWVHPLGPLTARDNLIQAISVIQPDGGTPLGEYLKKGADRLLQARQEQHGYGTYRLLVVTDGEANDQEEVDLYTPDILARGIVLNVIGVDMESDHTLKQSAHSYKAVDDPSSLARAVQEVFAEVSTAGADSVGADAFQVLDGLPDPFAMALLEALSSGYGNHPIGTSPSR